ncbi:sucrose-6-phosphate hydrolase [Photobacterium gaetbulicola]|uniref:Sucrose-6-phosphate hydrolase n=1 Tax=Photobacterium gaetbulicola TaxID=1295392 RepID=A0A0B9G952_9GAMM|nr:glycoside hydrolase family 32 protein [Photobacterium gaetbulicola]KHT61460.1 sucrose-6-phosphate hydrolase [Photobacterium gaetbulicola]
MTLTDILAACGGPNNLLRALRVEQQVILELKDPELRSDLARVLPFHSKLNQVAWTPEVPLCQADWEQLGRIIEQNQRTQLAAVFEIIQSPHRPLWHIAPPQGLLNDPNGFTYHNGEYHLFYQLYPFDCVHKDKYWAHVTSSDLVNWQSQPMALYPSDWFDSHGVFSGHAVSTDDELMLFYTGNVRIGEQRQRITTQCLATSSDGINFTKHGPVIDSLPPSVTPHCRDPKLVKNGDHWLMLLGAQQETDEGQLLGRLAIYRSFDLRQWEFVSLTGSELNNFGYMWECPDLFEMGEQLVAIICPQGIEADSHYHNVPHHNGYLQASLDENDRLELSEFYTLDHGFDFYAPQSTQAPDGRRLMIGWMGLPDEINQPSVKDKWLHQLTCLRELSWQNGKLYQQPARELQQLRGETQSFNLEANNEKSSLDLGSKSFELQTILPWPASGQTTLRVMDNGSEYCDIILDADQQRIRLDRSHAQPTDGETIRELPWPHSQAVELQLLADNSSLELFINQGEFAMTARVFTAQDATAVRLISDEPVSIDAKAWLLS